MIIDVTKIGLIDGTEPGVYPVIVGGGGGVSTLLNNLVAYYPFSDSNSSNFFNIIREHYSTDGTGTSGTNYVDDFIVKDNLGATIYSNNFESGLIGPWVKGGSLNLDVTQSTDFAKTGTYSRKANITGGSASNNEAVRNILFENNGSTLNFWFYISLNCTDDYWLYFFMGASIVAFGIDFKKQGTNNVWYHNGAGILDSGVVATTGVWREIIITFNGVSSSIVMKDAGGSILSTKPFTLTSIHKSTTESLSANNGFVYGATYTGSGLINGAFSFNAAAYNYIRIPATLANSTELTVSLWRKGTGGGTLFAFSGPSTNENKLQIQKVANTLYLYYKAIPLTSFAVAADSNRHHTVAYINYTTQVYKIREDSVLKTSSTNGSIVNFSLNTYDKGDFGMYNNGDRYTGELDEAGIWNRELLQTEIDELYNSGAGKTYPFT